MTATEAHTTEAFPIVWDDPKDAELCWRFDIEHTPDVVTPLGFDLYFGPLINGFGWSRACLQNYYVYDWFQESSFEAAAAGVDTAKLIQAARYFWDKIVPEVEGYTQRFLQTDFDGFSDTDLAAEIEKLPALRTRMGTLHTRALFPYSAGMRRLIATYQELAADDELAAVRLVQGYGNRSVDAGRALWQLSRQAASTLAVRRHIESVDRTTAGECMAALQREPEARPFLDAFAWTPLFAVACAVVTETGSVLSHAAVVAREYRIPAVLNAVDATRLIRDGQLVEVDGSQGIIRVIS